MGKIFSVVSTRKKNNLTGRGILLLSPYITICMYVSVLTRASRRTRDPAAHVLPVVVTVPVLFP